MSSYGWVITEDHVLYCKSRVGVMGPRDCKFSSDEIKSKGKKFAMHDDDGNLHFKGYLLGGSGFEPLDDFGMADTGCTRIKIGGRWL